MSFSLAEYTSPTTSHAVTKTIYDKETLQSLRSGVMLVKGKIWVMWVVIINAHARMSMLYNANAVAEVAMLERLTFVRMVSKLRFMLRMFQK